MWSSVQRGLLSVARSAYVEQARLWASGPGAWLALLAVKLASDGGEQDRVALAAVATGTYVLTTALVASGPQCYTVQNQVLGAGSNFGPVRHVAHTEDCCTECSTYV